ncbi:hypothetical protein [Pontivivens nitratireducens]|nr:hypothetical protein [Pontibrevibacter nitratireducens]
MRLKLAAINKLRRPNYFFFDCSGNNAFGLQVIRHGWATARLQ